MSRPRSQRTFAQHREARAFSLVELLVAAVLMMLSSIGGTALFNSATRQAQAIRMALEQQFTIGIDLARIETLADNYSCASATCTATFGGDPPNQNQYAPADPDHPDHDPTFRERCTAGLANGLVDLIDGTPSGAGPNVTRENGVTLASDSQNGSAQSVTPHRIRVQWRDTQTNAVLREVELIPTVASWCP